MSRTWLGPDSCIRFHAISRGSTPKPHLLPINILLIVCGAFPSMFRTHWRMFCSDLRLFTSYESREQVCCSYGGRVARQGT